MEEILPGFGLAPANFSVEPFGDGLINRTWLVKNKEGGEKYILQKINQQVFKQPEHIAYNIRLIGEYLQQHYPAYLFVMPCKTSSGDDLFIAKGAYFRMFTFIENSHTLNVVDQPGQAYEAARQFGRFSKLLSGLDASKLKITLPDFHDLGLRYRQFEQALVTGNPERIKTAAALISLIQKNKGIADEYDHCKTKLKIRCTHHDTKISNVLFNRAGKGLCVIDLDTVMPGFFISDVGDMMRTYLCPVSEEEQDFSKIRVREDYYRAVVDGYLSEMGEVLSETEKAYFPYAGEFMIYMQALRFLTDHLTNDGYYGASYEGQNFIRAGNQITLLQRLQEFQQNIISR